MGEGVDEIAVGIFLELYREAGQFKETYRQDQAIFPIVQDRVCVVALLVVAYVVVPLVANEYWLQAILIPFLILSLAARTHGVQKLLAQPSTRHSFVD
jgi:hypothetical protein